LLLGFSHPLRRITRVVSQHATELGAALDLASDLSDYFDRVDDLDFESLVVSLSVVKREVFVNGMS